MTEQLKHYKVYILEETLSGKSQQDIFNDVVTRYDITIHEAAEAVRKTPSLEKRNKYKTHNIILIIALLASMISGFVRRFIDLPENYIFLFPGILSFMLIYGLVNYKYPAHLFAGIFLTVLSATLIGFLFIRFEFRVLFELLLTLGATLLAYYLNSKLISDYIYHREKVQNDPTIRADAVTFTG